VLECRYKASGDDLGHSGENLTVTAEAILSGNRVAEKHYARIAVILQANIEDRHGETAGSGVA
jgi:hypothetical protein